jgi:toxin HigB-1
MLVIQSFGDSLTEALFHGRRNAKTRRVPADVQRAALRQLDALNAAAALKDLRSPPGNRLEVLRGDHEGQHSVRVNEQWRIVFRWSEAGPADVAIVDYH